MTTATQVAARLGELAALIGLRPDALPDFRPNGEARPFLQVDNDGTLHWRVNEAGRTVEDRTTTEEDELLYWAFRAATATAAADWEAGHREPGADSRRARWARQQDLLVQLDPRWAERWRTELAAELRATAATGDLTLLPPSPPAG